MNQKYKRAEIEKKILAFCETPKSSKELSILTGVNLNTLRSKYIYPLFNKNRIHRHLRKYKTIKKL